MQPHTATAAAKLTAFAIVRSIRLLASTLRYEHAETDARLAQMQDHPMIVCIWHNRLALSLSLYQRFIAKKPYPSHRLAALVSASRDGAMLSEILKYFNVQPVRGSSTRRGGQALKELVTWARKGWTLAITPDGPRGPRYQVQDGVIATAQLTGLPILPVSYELKTKLVTKSWDRFQIPCPFTTCNVRTADPISVPRSIDPKTRASIKAQLQSAMEAITFD
ncbi:MAG: hypothetical protein M2R45_02093 [Verrucomicrobia subdivision 3 bacterium]|nr:hypothetical protein [Limisphaerales bacterium]MCS1413848.1 hypothetical protein [Limisphaerales bacterium]